MKGRGPLQLFGMTAMRRSPEKGQREPRDDSRKLQGQWQCPGKTIALHGNSVAVPT